MRRPSYENSAKTSVAFPSFSILTVATLLFGQPWMALATENKETKPDKMENAENETSGVNEKSPDYESGYFVLVGAARCAAISCAAFVSTPGLPRKPRSLNQSMKRSCHVPKGAPSRAFSIALKNSSAQTA